MHRTDSSRFVKFFKLHRKNYKIYYYQYVI